MDEATFTTIYDEQGLSRSNATDPTIPGPLLDSAGATISVKIEVFGVTIPAALSTYTESFLYPALDSILTEVEIFTDQEDAVSEIETHSELDWLPAGATTSSIISFDQITALLSAMDTSTVLKIPSRTVTRTSPLSAISHPTSTLSMLLSTTRTTSSFASAPSTVLPGLGPLYED